MGPPGVSPEEALVPVSCVIHNTDMKSTVSKAEAARLERLADYSESGDVTKHVTHGRPGPGFPGRPSLTGLREQARVSQLLYDRLDERARTNGTTISDVLREAIEKL